MNEINVRNEILDSINNVNIVTMESGLDVLCSIGAAYEKAALILENTTSDVSCFSIFQEVDNPSEEKPATNPTEGGEAAKEDEPTTVIKSGATPADAERAEVKKTPAPQTQNNKDKSAAWKIIHFIPNLLAKLWNFIKEAWNGIIVPKAEVVVEKLSNNTRNILEEISDKDESWIKANAKTLGLTGAGLAAVLGLVAACKNASAIQNTAASLFGTIALVFKAAKIAPKIEFKTDGCETNIDVVKIPKIFGRTKVIYAESIKTVKALKDAGAKDAFSIVSKTLSSISEQNLGEDGNPINQNSTKIPYTDLCESLQQCIDECKKETEEDKIIKEGAGSKDSEASYPEFEDKTLNETKKLDQKNSLFSKITSGIIKFFSDFVTKIKEILGLVQKVESTTVNDTSNSTEGDDSYVEDVNEDETSETGTDAGESSGETEQTATPEETSTETGTSTTEESEPAPTIEDGGAYSVAQLQKLTNNKIPMRVIGKNPLIVNRDKNVVEKPFRIPGIPGFLFQLDYNDYKYHAKPDPNYHAESAVSGIDVDDTIIFESYEVTVDPETINHWYR